jgi:hypothetical protein
MPEYEPNIGFQAINALLANDVELLSVAPGRVRRGKAKPKSAIPYVIMSYQSGHDVLTATGVRIMLDATYLVKAVGPERLTESIFQAAARIDALLDTKNQSVPAGGFLLSGNRDSPVTYDEDVNGEQWLHAGGMYRLIVQQT